LFQKYLNMAMSFRRNGFYSLEEVVMAIIVRLDRIMADRKISLNELAKAVDMTNVNLSNLKTGKMKGIKFETMNAICSALKCHPGDIFEYVEDKEK